MIQAMAFLLVAALQEKEKPSPKIPEQPGSKDEFTVEFKDGLKLMTGIDRLNRMERKGGEAVVRFFFDTDIVRKLPRVGDPEPTVDHECVPAADEPKVVEKFSGEAFSRLLATDVVEAPDSDLVDVDASVVHSTIPGWFKPVVFVVGGRFYQKGRFSQVITEIEWKVTNPGGSGVKLTPQPRILKGEKKTKPLPRFDRQNPYSVQVRLHDEGKPERQRALVMMDSAGLKTPVTPTFLGEPFVAGQTVSMRARFETFAFENCDLTGPVATLPTHRFDWGIDVEMKVVGATEVPTGTIRLAPVVAVIADPDAGDGSTFGEAKKNDPGGSGEKGNGVEPGFTPTQGTVVRTPFE